MDKPPEEQPPEVRRIGGSHASYRAIDQWGREIPPQVTPQPPRPRPEQHKGFRMIPPPQENPPTSTPLPALVDIPRPPRKTKEPTKPS